MAADAANTLAQFMQYLFTFTRPQQVMADAHTANSNKNTPYDEETLRIVEACIFASAEVMSVQRLKSILPEAPHVRTVREMVARINRDLHEQQHPFEIVEVADGFQFRTVARYAQWVKRSNEKKDAKRLSPQALECLSIVAYRQPVTKAQIDAIRGSGSDGSMKTLLEKKLITITGRSDKPGNPLLYATTKEFLCYFGLKSLNELPKLEEFEEIARKKTQQMLAQEKTQQSPDQSRTSPQQDQSAASRSDDTVQEDAAAPQGPSRHSPQSSAEAPDEDAPDGDAPDEDAPQAPEADGPPDTSPDTAAQDSTDGDPPHER
jgi:segregation and condensation protein B